MCFVGRPYVYGLVLGGEDGVKHVPRGLVGELSLNLHLSGIESAAKRSFDQGGRVVSDGEISDRKGD